MQHKLLSIGSVEVVSCVNYMYVGSVRKGAI